MFVAFSAAAFAALLVGGPGNAAPGGQTRLLVGFTASSPAAARAQTLDAVDATDASTISDLRVHVVTVPKAEAGSALARLRATAGVKFAELDGVVTPQEFLPRDPSFPQTFAVAGGAWGWYQTHTTQAWDITEGDPSVVVAVLDTGLRTQGLADFAGQVVPGWNVMTNSADTSSNAGTHGTYVAGAVGLAVDNGVGNAGYCPRCRIMPVQVGTDSGAALSDLASGVTWATDHGARVINLSWAGTSSSSTLTSAVSYARARGVVVVAAAGNSNCDCVTYPSATPGVIGVGGTDNSGNKAGDSNYGSWVKVAAPEGTMTAWPTINGLPGYAPVGGTSLAAPVVAGIAGLLFSANPALSGAQVEQALESTAAAVPFTVTYGRVDALAALQSLGFSDPQPSSLPVNASAPEIYLETNGVYNSTPLGSNSPQVGQLLLRGQGSWTGSAPLSISALKWQRCDPTGATCTVVSTSSTYTVQAADTGYSLRLDVTVRNGLGSVGATSSLSTPVGGSAPPPVAPTNTALPAVSGSAVDGATLSVSTGSWNGSPSSFSYQWRRCDASGANCADVAKAGAALYVLGPADVGFRMRARVTASNAAGSADAASAASPLVTEQSAGPQSFSFSGTLAKNVASQSFGVTMGAGEADATLSLSKSAAVTLKLVNGAGVTVGQVSGSGSTLQLNVASLFAGQYTYVVSASGLRGSLSFTLAGAAPAP
jgi:thermitase